MKDKKIKFFVDTGLFLEALKLQNKLLDETVKDPKFLKKLPKRGLLLPRERIIIPSKNIKTINDFRIVTQR